MKLVPEQAVRNAMQLDTISLIDAAVTASLHAGTEALKNYLLTEFDAASYTEIFWVQMTLRSGSNYRAVLALKNGFLTAAPTVVYAGSYAGLSSPTTLDPSEYRVNLTKGSVTIDSQTDYADQYFQIVYSAGFTADSVDTTLYDQTKVPVWLQQAAIYVAAGNVQGLNPDLDGSGQGSSKFGGGGGGGHGIGSNAMITAGLAMAANNVRYFPTSVRPI